MSDEDLPAGAVWFDEISSEIRSSEFAIACVTRSNASAPWMLWESGALYGRIGDKTRVVPLLVDAENSWLSPPLSMFQAVHCASQLDVKNMLYEIASAFNPPLDKASVDNALARYWPEFRESVLSAIKGDRPYAISWAEQINVIKRMCGDHQKVALFAVNTSATLEQIRSLRWSWERRVEELGTSVFVIPDKPGYVIVLNSIAQRVLGQMRGRDETYVFGPPEGPLWVRPEDDTNADYGDDEWIAETAEEVWELSWAAAGLPTDPRVTSGMEVLRYTFEHRLISAGVAWDDIDTLMGRSARVHHYFHLNLPHLLACAETVVTRQEATIIRE